MLEPGAHGNCRQCQLRKTRGVPAGDTACSQSAFSSIPFPRESYRPAYLLPCGTSHPATDCLVAAGDHFALPHPALRDQLVPRRSGRVLA
ncbi:hypothetical protein D3C71_1788200 [compost metagenome]